VERKESLLRSNKRLVERWQGMKAILIAIILSLIIIPISLAEEDQDNEDKPIVWIENIIQIVGEGWGIPHRNLERECVILKSKEAVNLKDWILMDIKEHKYIFPDVVIDGELRVCTGIGEDTEEILYQNRKRAVWNQEGDTAFLYDDKGVLIYEFSYDEIMIEEED